MWVEDERRVQGKAGEMVRSEQVKGFVCLDGGF